MPDSTARDQPSAIASPPTVSTSITPPAALLSQDFPLSNLVENAVIAEARRLASTFKFEDSADLNNHTIPIQPKTLSIACLMDSLFRYLCTYAESDKFVAWIPTDDVLARMLRRMSEGQNFFESVANNFKPNARETMRILMEEFDNLPGLREIKARNRWRLIVDRQMVDVLARHGLDTNNPLLAFIFDSDKGYAHSVAKGWVATARALQDKKSLDLDVVLDIHRAAGVGRLTGLDEGTQFGARYDYEGRKELVSYLLRSRDESGIVRTIRVREREPNLVIRLIPKKDIEVADVATSVSDLDALSSLCPTTDDLGALIEEAALGREEIVYISIERDPISQKQSKNVLKRYIARYHSELGKAANRSDKICAALTLFHNAEHLHPFSDGNYRMFGKFILNFSLVSQGESMTELYSSHRAEGQSPECNVVAVEEGQSWLRQLA